MVNPRSLALAAALLCSCVASAQPSIVIADDTIVVAGKPLSITVKRFLSVESPELVEVLVARRAQAPEENPCGQIQAPGSAAFALIRRVLSACTTAGLTSIGLRERSAQPSLAVSTGSTASKVRVILSVTTTNLRLTVGGSVTGPFATGALLEKIQAVRVAVPGQLAITVQVEDAVPFTALLEVLEACIRGGLSQVTLKSNGPSQEPPPTPEVAADLLVMGSIDKELIRTVVTSHQAEVRGCFEKVLVSFPMLDAKASLKFTISADGTVSSSVAESTSNTELSTCISDRVKTWVFPRPRGGGVVVVTYPFTFTMK